MNDASEMEYINLDNNVNEYNMNHVHSTKCNSNDNNNNNSNSKYNNPLNLSMNTFEELTNNSSNNLINSNFE